jgi:hypothetical protein
MASNFIKLIKFKNPRSTDFSGRSFTFRNTPTPNNLKIKPLSINDGYIPPSVEGVSPQPEVVTNLETIDGTPIVTINGESMVTI